MLDAAADGTPTIATRLEAASGQPRGFDLLRIILTLLVIFCHSLYSTFGSDFVSNMWASAWRPFLYLILPVFFSLSGFLVSGSLVRSKSLTEFLMLRALRIVPALTVEVFIAAILIGPLVTVKNLSEYFTDPTFFKYFSNIFGKVHYNLPGVFLDNPATAIVNISLWTVPYELECYIILALLALFGALKHHRALLLLIPLAGAAILVLSAFRGADIDWTSRPPGRLLVASFLAGVILYLVRSSVRVSFTRFILALLVTLALLYHPRTAYLSVLPAAYVTVYLGTLNIPKSFLPKSDYSYGMYLYAFPMQQLYYHLFKDDKHFGLNMAFAVIASFICAFFSWNLVEHPILRKKRFVIAVVNDAQHRLRPLMIGLARGVRTKLGY